MLVWGLVGVILYEGVVRCVEIVACARGTQSQYTECEGTKPRLMLIIGCLGLLVNIGYAVILAWGGAEVKHAHSHGGGGDDDHHHGHSHSHGGAAAAAASSSHGHSHHGGGGSCGGGEENNEDDHEAASTIKCCEPTKEELACEKEECEHEHIAAQKKKDTTGYNNNTYASIDSGDTTAVSVVSLKTTPNLKEDNDDCEKIKKENEGGKKCGKEKDDADATTTKKNAADKSISDTLFGSDANMNIRGAAIHALGDCLQSVGVIIAAGVIWGGCGVEGDAHSYYNIADPACSLLFGFITLWTTKSLFVEIFEILMERAPRGIHVSCIKKKLEHYPAIVEVKDIFIWSISNDRTALGAHCVVSKDATTDQIFDTLDRARVLCTQLGFCMSAIEVLREGDESAAKYKTLSAASPTKHGHDHGHSHNHGHSH